MFHTERTIHSGLHAWKQRATTAHLRDQDVRFTIFIRDRFSTKLSLIKYLVNNFRITRVKLLKKILLQNSKIFTLDYEPTFGIFNFILYFIFSAVEISNEIQLTR